MGLRFVLCAWLLVSCSSAGDDADKTPGGASGSGGPKRNNPGNAPVLTRRLMLSTTVARLEFGARLTVRGLLLDEEREPVGDQRVSFALAGYAEGSALDALDARTDLGGAFQTALTAGERPSAFHVRVSANDAADAFIDVSVSDEGFGSLLVTATYDGERLVAQRSVFAQAGAYCDRNVRGEGDPVVALSEDQQEARMPALPAGVDYAVTAVAHSALGTLVARGCVDGVVVESDTDSTLEIEFTDEPLARSGEFTLLGELDASGPASVLSVELAGATTALIIGDTPGVPTPVDADARFLLNVLDETLRSEDDAESEWLALAEALELDRGDGPVDEDTPDHELQALLGLEEKGPQVAIADIAQFMQADLARMRLTASLVLQPTGDVPATWRPLRIEALPVAEQALPMVIDLTQVQAAASSRAEFVAEDDELHLSRLRFRANFGALATQVLRGVLRTHDEGGQLQLLRTDLGCAQLSQWLAGKGYPGECDDNCVEAACDRALATLQSAAEDALSALDSARPTVSFRGEFTLRDHDGDLIVETMECEEFRGEWAASNAGATGDLIAGRASAVALLPLR